MSTIKFPLVEMSIVDINNYILTCMFIVDTFSYVTDIANGIIDILTFYSS